MDNTRATLTTQTKLITAWLAANIADSLSTYYILELGGQEIGLFHHLTHNMLWTTVGKYSYIFLVVLVLYKYDRIHWLTWFTIGMLCVLAWNIAQLALYPF